jgi:hypothetical protein
MITSWVDEEDKANAKYDAKFPLVRHDLGGFSGRGGRGDVK